MIVSKLIATDKHNEPIQFLFAAVVGFPNRIASRTQI